MIENDEQTREEAREGAREEAGQQRASVLLKWIREITGEDGRVLPEKARRIHSLVLEAQQDSEKRERQCRIWLGFYGRVDGPSVSR